jgi:hypothetical protein
MIASDEHCVLAIGHDIIDVADGRRRYCCGQHIDVLMNIVSVS